MNHEPSKIVAEMLRLAGLFTNPDEQGAWPLYISHMPDVDPVEGSACVYDTTGVVNGRILDTGVHLRQYGVQVSMRSAKYTEGYAKASAVESYLETALRVEITLDNTTYLVYSIALTSPVLSLGTEPGTTKRRSLFTVNGLVMLKQVS